MMPATEHQDRDARGRFLQDNRCSRGLALTPTSTARPERSEAGNFPVVRQAQAMP